jgi:hypothetical protein
MVSWIICVLRRLVMHFIPFISRNNWKLTVDDIFIKHDKFSKLVKVQKNTGSIIFTVVGLPTLHMIVIDVWPVNSKDKFRIAAS